MKSASFPPTSRSQTKYSRRHVQEINRSPSIAYGERGSHLQFKQETNPLKDQVRPVLIKCEHSDESIVDLNQDAIELAITQRVALFFQQSILCYKMGSHFTFSIASSPL